MKGTPRPGRSAEPLGGRRYTLMVVPEGGRSAMRQATVTLGQIRLLVGLFGVLVVFAVSGFVATSGSLSRNGTCSELLDENLSLKARLKEIEGKLDQVDRELRRLRLYDTQLQDLPADGIPGFGPLEDDEASAAAWLGYDLTGPPPGDELEAMGEPMGEAGLVSLSAADWGDALYARTESTLADMQLAETELGDLVESAEQWRTIRAAMPSEWPLDGVLTSGFGYRRSPINHTWKFHRGLDIYAPMGTAIMAPASGLIIAAEWNQGYGQMIEIDHGFGVVTRYAHQSRLFVHPGDEVVRGQVISTVGMTGQTTGPHLHYEVMVDGRPVDPLEYLQ